MGIDSLSKNLIKMKEHRKKILSEMYLGLPKGECNRNFSPRQVMWKLMIPCAEKVKHKHFNYKRTKHEV